MTPNLAHMELPAIAAVEAGADGLAAINTVKSITGVDLDSMASLPQVDGRSAVSGYSGKAVKPIALRFIYDMASCDRLKGGPISGMGGIETWQDAAEFLALLVPAVLTADAASATADTSRLVKLGIHQGAPVQLLRRNDLAHSGTYQLLHTGKALAFQVIRQSVQQILNDPVPVLHHGGGNL